MPTVSLPAHFDGERIVLDEPYELPPNVPLVVTVLPVDDPERRAWHEAGARALARAYGDDEPDYTLDDLRANR